MRTFAGRVAFVTGGASGIGYALAGRAAAREMTASWMDPVELGAMVVEGIRSNAPYILTHVDFRDEVREMCGLLDAAFPPSRNVPAERRAFEDGRRAIIRERRALPVKD
jgi:NAD(P)-dependent dehydrogenase (short-subunit alcohol dehydrogenase family)